MPPVNNLNNINPTDIPRVPLVDIEKSIINRFNRRIGKKGGDTTKARHGPEYYVEIGRLGGAITRGLWKKEMALRHRTTSGKKKGKSKK